MVHPDPRQLSRDALDLCRDLGFALAGVCEARATDRRAEFLAWLDAGKQGGMSWLAERVEERMDPARLLPGARSIIMVADVYAETGASEASSKTPQPRLLEGTIARYARGDDYHAVMKRRLHQLCDALRERFPSERFRAFVDTAPVLEREHAARAGLGWIGKHTLLIHPHLGSWFFLGGVLTTLELPPPEEQRPIADHCGTCTRCIDACPTRAIRPWSVDATRCISYLTIEHRGPIAEEFHVPIGRWLFGCDICQEVCPHNRAREVSPAREQGTRPHPAYAPRRDSFDLLGVLGWTEEDRRRALARSALKRAKPDMWKRNALIVAGNVLAERDEPALRRRIEEVACDGHECEMVRETARAVAARRAPPPIGRGSGGGTPVASGNRAFLADSSGAAS